MAFSAGVAGGRGRGSRRGRRYSPMSEINVTPLVDVMLVLLIVFMISAPLLTVGVPVDLPQSGAGELAPDNTPIMITVNSDGRIFLQETEVTVDVLVERLLALAGGGFDDRIFVRGDRTSSYGAIMAVMGEISGAGFSRIGLLSLPDAN